MEKFQWADGERVCPTCGQAMPAEKVQAAREAEEQRFEAEKKAKLGEIRQRGAEAAQEVETLTAALTKLDAEIAETAAKTAEAQQRRDAVSEEVKSYPQAPEYGSNPRVGELRQQIAELQAKMSKSPEEKVAGLIERRAELQAKMDEKKAVIARRDAGIETEKRIAELEQQQKDIGAALA